MSFTQEGGNQLDQIFFVHQLIHVIVEGNAKKLHKNNTNLDEMTKVFKGFRTPKKSGNNHFFRKLQETTKENFKKTLLDS